MTSLRAKAMFVLAGFALIAAAALIAVAVTHSASKHRVRPASAVKAVAGPSKPNSGPGGDIDWDRPFVDGVTMASLAEANQRVPIKTVAPVSIGTPAAIVVHGASVPADKQAVAYVYHSTKYGTFQAIEGPTTETPGELASLAASCDPANGCEGTWKMVDLANGTQALLIAGPQTTGLVWIDAGRRFDVYGPAATFALADAEALASTFAAAAAAAR